jgi:hypothetical protein
MERGKGNLFYVKRKTSRQKAGLENRYSIIYKPLVVKAVEID